MSPRKPPPSNDAGLAVAILQALTAADAKHCVLRNFEDLPDEVGNDLDVLVEPHSLPEAVACATDVATSQGWSLAASECGYSMRALVFTRGDDTLRVDFFTDLTKGWLVYGDASAVLGGRTEASGLFVADFRDVTYTVVVKEWLTYGEVRRKYERLLREHPLTESDFMSQGAGLFTTESLCAVHRAVFGRTEESAAVRLRPTWRNLLRPAAALRWLFSRVWCSVARVAWRRS